jgi:acetolactate synthase-1/2/3 large subunit
LSQTRCWDIIVDALGREGVEYAFGLPGNPQALYDSLIDSDVEAVLVRHETSGVFMAMAYAKLRRRPGVCFGSPGPGVANLVPGVLEAFSACSPLVVLGSSASTELEGKGAFQEAPQMELFTPITKWAFRIPSAVRASWAMRRAFSLAINGKPGPVYIDVPFNVGQSKTSHTEYIPAEGPFRFRPNMSPLKKAAELLLDSERPLIIAGGGALASGASKKLIEFSELLATPVLTTPCGRGVIPESHPLSLGLVGLYRTRLGRRVYDEADLILSLGSRNEEFQTNAWRYFPNGAKLVQVDIDPYEIGRNWVPDVALIGDIKLTLEDMLSILKRELVKKPLSEMPRLKGILEAKEAFLQEVAEECRDGSIPIKSKRVVHEANEVFGGGTILVNENGSQDLWSYYYPYYRVLDIDGCLAPAEQTCMGFGVAGAIGAKLAVPDKNVLCTTGDGAFQMFMKELPTAVQYKAPVTWVVLNNYSLGWIKLHQKVAEERYIAVDFDVQPDFAAMAEASGCFGVQVRAPSDVRSALEEALRQNLNGVPAVLDFVVDPWDFPDGFKEAQPELFK